MSLHHPTLLVLQTVVTFSSSFIYILLSPWFCPTPQAYLYPLTTSMAPCPSPSLSLPVSNSQGPSLITNQKQPSYHYSLSGIWTICFTTTLLTICNYCCWLPHSNTSSARNDFWLVTCSVPATGVSIWYILGTFLGTTEYVNRAWWKCLFGTAWSVHIQPPNLTAPSGMSLSEVSAHKFSWDEGLLHSL